MEKYINVLVNFLTVIIFIIATLITIVTLNTKQFGITKIGNMVPITISSESMISSLKKDDLLFTEVYNKKDKLKKGDIITFLTFKDYKTVVETHRIYKVINDGGLLSYKTRGDNEKKIDSKILIANDIVSVYTGNKVKYAGKLLDLLRNKNMFFITVILPLFLIIGYFTFDLFIKDEEHCA